MLISFLIHQNGELLHADTCVNVQEIQTQKIKLYFRRKIRNKNSAEGGAWHLHVPVRFINESNTNNSCEEWQIH